MNQEIKHKDESKKAYQVTRKKRWADGKKLLSTEEEDEGFLQKNLKNECFCRILRRMIGPYL